MQVATGTRMLRCHSLGSFADLKPASGAVNDSLGSSDSTRMIQKRLRWQNQPASQKITIILK